MRGVPDDQQQAHVDGERELVSPLEGEMSPKATEGVVSRRSPASSVVGRGWRFTRGDPLWPLRGHLPLEGGD
ncbi:MAG: hypothetical protein EOS40_33925 [Mesorhizobium sp.]|nr:MAG: hypothetical protein EOQ40_20535 [Mesorhizobium sp.]RWD96196.1 MAG: hypothetical protein EOS40_33925 [Mesorhizobium sp.]